MGFQQQNDLAAGLCMHRSVMTGFMTCLYIAAKLCPPKTKEKAKYSAVQSQFHQISAKLLVDQAVMQCNAVSHCDVCAVSR